MKLNKKVMLVVMTALLIIFVNCKTEAYCCGSCCNKKIIGIGTTVVILLAAIGYQVLWNPYKMIGPVPNSSLSTTLKNLYSSSIVNKKTYDEVPTIASHNSFTYPDTKIKLSDRLSPQTVLTQNQILDTNQQLEFGVRTFLIDIQIKIIPMLL